MASVVNGDSTQDCPEGVWTSDDALPSLPGARRARDDRAGVWTNGQLAATPGKDTRGVAGVGYARSNQSSKERAMPFINVKLIEGVFTADQKRQMIRKLTDCMVEIEGEAMRPVTWTVIEEVKSGDWAIAGKPLSTSDVKALAGGRSEKG
ncbi:MAG TPA: tautomerase family protein [Steroidobacteraceae bacterium]|nr:tautomerase family protein [Steroidobacteraceae bacterium]